MPQRARGLLLALPAARLRLARQLPRPVQLAQVALAQAAAGRLGQARSRQPLLPRGLTLETVMCRCQCDPALLLVLLQGAVLPGSRWQPGGQLPSALLAAAHCGGAPARLQQARLPVQVALGPGGHLPRALLPAALFSAAPARLQQARLPVQAALGPGGHLPRALLPAALFSSAPARLQEARLPVQAAQGPDGHLPRTLLAAALFAGAPAKLQEARLPVQAAQGPQGPLLRAAAASALRLQRARLLGRWQPKTSWESALPPQTGRASRRRRPRRSLRRWAQKLDTRG